jgi:muramidase (phage lysozyme)
LSRTTVEADMHRLLITALLSCGFPCSSGAQDYWSEPGNIRSAVAAAAALYADEPAHDPYRAVVLDDSPPELAAIYAALDERLPPTRIYSFSNDPTAGPDYSSLPSTFPPGSAEDIMIGFIRKHEAGRRGYDSVWSGNRHPLPRRPTEMTVCGIRDWQIEAAKGQASSAIGLFQIVGPTFRSITAKMNLGCDLLFDPKTQDRIGLALLYGRGWAEFKAGTMSVADFAYELAGEWAAFPAPYGANKGFSRYRNIAGNRHQIGLSAYLAFLTGLRTGIQSGTVMSSGEHVQPDVASAGAVGVVRDSPDDAMVQRSVPAGPSSAPLQVVEIEDAGRLQILTFAKD